jgi:hypothetical protein
MRDAEQLKPTMANGSREVSANSHERETGDAQQAEIVHGLNNVLVSIMLNAQLIGWKLPSYSRLRRNVHEIERSTQRAGTLLKRLLAEERPRENPATCVADAGEDEGTSMPHCLGAECD